MSLIRVQSVRLVGDNPAPFSTPICFDITCECMAPGVQEEVEWSLTYVGSAADETKDQELASVLVGPHNVGLNRFQLQTDGAPDPTLIPPGDLLDTTVLLLIGKYREREFVRIGYFVNNTSTDNACADTILLINDVAADPKVRADQLHREIDMSTPRMTMYTIGWDVPEAVPAMTASDAFLALQQANAAEAETTDEAPPADEDDAEDDVEEEDEEADEEEDEEIDLVSTTSEDASPSPKAGEQGDPSSMPEPEPQPQSEWSSTTSKCRAFSSPDGPAAAAAAAASSVPASMELACGASEESANASAREPLDPAEDERESKRMRLNDSHDRSQG
jgi:histone chaperone ASF1